MRDPEDQIAARDARIAELEALVARRDRGLTEARAALVLAGKLHLAGEADKLPDVLLRGDAAHAAKEWWREETEDRDARIAELEELLRGVVDLGIASARRGMDVVDDLLHEIDGALLAGEPAAARDARIAELEARVALAEGLLARVVIHGGSGSWTWRQMYDWCCDYKDFANGLDPKWVAQGHDQCAHRARPGSSCGGVGAGDSDVAIPGLFGPEGLAAVTAERDALLEAARELLTVAELRGDTELPHPSKDPREWTARMQDAWYDLADALTRTEPAAKREEASDGE